MRVRDGRTNLEDTLAEVFGADDSSSGKSTPISVTVENGTVRLLSSETAALTSDSAFTTISRINATYSTLDQSKAFPDIAMIASVGNPVELSATTEATQPEALSGVDPRIAASLDELAGDFPLLPFSETQMAVLAADESKPSLMLTIAPSNDTEGVQNLVLEARKLKLAELEPLIRRLLPGTRCLGQVSCRLQAHLLKDNADGGFAGRLQLLGEEVRWRNTSWAIGESLDLESVSAQGAVVLAADGLLVNDLKIRSSVLDLSGSGEVKMAAQDPVKAIRAAANQNPDQQDALARAEAMAAGQVKLQGRIDLAACTRMLPRTLNVAEGVTVESGALQFSCRILQNAATPGATQLFDSSQPGFRWQLVAETAPLRMIRDRQPVTLEEPLRLDAVGNMTTETASVSRARLAGTFGSLTADPLNDGYSVTGTVYPDRLWNDLRQLIDIPRPGLTSDVQVEGQVVMLEDAIRLSSVALMSEEVKIESGRLTVFPSAPILQMFDGTLTVRGTAPALKTLIAPWHNASWLSDNSTVAARLTSEPGQAIELQAGIRPTASSGRVASSASAFVLDEGQLDASLMADVTPGQFVVQQGVVKIPGVSAGVSGIVGVEGGVLVLNLDADTQYDLDVLTQRLLSDPERKIQLSGRNHDVFHLEGSPSLWTQTDLANLNTTTVASTSSRNDAASLLKPLEATGRIAWDGGQLYGLALGPTAVVAQLHNGLVRTEPVQCSFGTGEIVVMPQWDMNSNLVQLAPGSRIQNLQVTPELSREWLGYLAPMLADSAHVQGTVSARLQQFDYFIDRPEVSTIKGEINLLNTKASAGQSLGPLLQVLALVDREGAGQLQQLDFPDQTVPFEMRDGMVLHDGLQVQLGDYRMSSRGGVGIDQRIQMVLTVPMEKNATSSSTARTLQIPVGGTVTRPQLDTRGLMQNLGRQQIQNQVDKQLDRGIRGLFDKLK